MTTQRSAVLALGLLLAASGAEAAPRSAAAKDGAVVVAQAAAPAAGRRQSGGIGDFGSANSNKPINVEADKLEVFQKEGRAIYSGNVIAVQGETTMKCTQLVVFFDQSKTGTPGASPPAASATAASPSGGGGDQAEALKKLECKGPVSVVAKSEGKTQVATGDNAIYDRLAGFVTLTGNVNLADGPNISRCQSFVYNTNSGKADCTGGPRGGRVQGVFETGNQPAAPKTR
ncbi:MAG: hypothetical protein BGP06_00940 [Rhizobiales bacterium 65-9]|nr:hypothetical protein [Hyphomicrobiales bacterium]OJY37323.1 MAG: hypothetical protein BGP06_00940 [Rhizobiales bacterium 65-9]